MYRSAGGSVTGPLFASAEVVASARSTWDAFAMNIDELRTLFAYDSWANDLLFEAARRLPGESIRRDLGTSHQSLLGILVHLVAAEEIWLSRWKGAPRSKLTGLDEIASLDALFAWWGAVRAERDAFLATLVEADLEREMEMATTAGATYRHRHADMFRHLANHSTYHRGQAAAILRLLGEKPPSTDLIRFYREAR
jgi:uncharacterized damage-inducible protein DinB